MTTEQSTITCEDETSHAAALNENKESAANGSASNTPRRRRDSIMKQRSSMVGIKDNVKKSVCFSTTPDLRITAADDCFRVMREGTEFIKLRKADRQYLRCFYLTEQQDEVMWYPTKKPSKARLKIDEVREIRVGRNTPLLRTHEFATRYNEDCQFSIVFGEEYESLDLVARTPELANVWIAGLNALLAQRNDARRRNQTSFDAFGSARSNRVSAVSDDFDAIALGAPSSSPPLLSNGDAPHMGNPVCVTNRSLSCPSTALMNRSRKPSEACFCGEPPIGEHDDRLEFEPPVVFELGDTPLRRTSSSSTGEQSQTHSLSQLIDTCSNCAGLRDRWLRETFVRADLQRCGVLRETDALCAMQSAGFDVCPFRLRRKMMELDASKTEEERGQLNVEQFVKLCKELFTRPDVYFLLTRYASNAEYLTFGELIFFLETEQGVKLSRNEVIELIYRFEPTREGKEHLHMGIDGLTSYLLSPDCCVFDTRHYSLCQDMTQPLAHYFISASHNTYLIEDQLSGPCSTDGFVHALQRGCRYVEVDVYDGEEGQPIVTRCAAKSSPLTLSSTLEAINKYAFVASEYPVIVGLTVHCSLQQQFCVAQQLRMHFGESLFAGLDEGTTFSLSPEALRRRVLIKSRRCDPHLFSSTARCASDEEPEFGYVSSDYDSQNEADKDATGRQEKRHCLSRQLSSLVTCLWASSFRNIDATHRTGVVYTLSEKAAQAIAATRSDQLVSMCKSAVVCVSPDGSRTDSSNLAPHEFWSCGCQIVALNWQSPGMPIDVNAGFFRQNGACGYVLKPAAMRDPIATFHPALSNASPDINPKLFTIKILSAQLLPKPKGSTARGDYIEPFIVVQFFGVASDCSQQRTRTVEYDGSVALVNESFEVLAHVPQLVTVRFLVLDDNSLGDDFIAQYSAPLECVRTGYRHVPLFGFDGVPLSGARLFVHSTVTSVDAFSSATQAASRRKSIVSRLSTGSLNMNTSTNCNVTSNSKQSRERSKSSIAVRRAQRSATALTIRALVEPRPTGTKVVDELFESISSALHCAVDRRDAVNGAFTQLREACGLPASASAKQCVRYFLNALLQSSNSNALRCVSVFLNTADVRRMRVASNQVSDGSSTQLQATPLADALEKVMLSLNKLIDECNALINEADTLLETLNNCYERALGYHQTVINDNDDAAPTSQQIPARQRVEQRLENYRWNVRVVKAQAEALSAAKSSCFEVIEQIRSSFEQQVVGSGSGTSSCVSICRVSSLPVVPETVKNDGSRKAGRKTSIVERLRSSVTPSSSSRIPISRTLSRDILD